MTGPNRHEPLSFQPSGFRQPCLQWTDCQLQRETVLSPAVLPAAVSLRAVAWDRNDISRRPSGHELSGRESPIVRCGDATEESGVRTKRERQEKTRLDTRLATITPVSYTHLTLPTKVNV